jgi:hypothetical protein
MTLILLLQILVSLIFFANKVFVLAGKKTGWLLGAVAATIAVFYFFLIELYVYTALEFGLIILMGYGFFKKEKKSPRTEKAIQATTVTAMLLLALFACSGLMTLVELLSSLGLLAGTYALTHSKQRTGWLLYVVAHCLAALLGYNKGQLFFADFQIASAIVSLVGAIQVKRAPSV